MKLGEVVVHMGTTTSPNFIKIGLKTKKFFNSPLLSRLHFFSVFFGDIETTSQGFLKSMSSSSRYSRVQQKPPREVRNMSRI